MNEQYVYNENEIKERDFKNIYYRLTYVDDYGKTHIAKVKDTLCLHYLEDRFEIIETSIKENLTF